jgi:response regulator NasT
MLRVLVIAESADHAAIVREGLQLAGHELADVVPPTDGLATALERSKANAIVLEAESPGIDLLDRVVDAMGEHAVPLIVFSADSSAETIERGVRAGASAYVVDGLRAARVPAIMQVAVSRFDFVSGLRSELGVAQQKLAERKFVERAKGLLMKARNLSEEEAYHTLRRMAMERNRRMGDVAKSVIEMADLLN